MLKNPNHQDSRNCTLHRLRKFKAQGALSAEVAYVLAGAVSLFWHQTNHSKSQPTTFRQLAVGAVLLLMVLSIAGPVLGNLQSVFQALGHRPSIGYIAASAALLFWLRCRGKKVLAPKPA